MGRQKLFPLGWGLCQARNPGSEDPAGLRRSGTASPRQSVGRIHLSRIHPL